MTFADAQHADPEQTFDLVAVVRLLWSYRILLIVAVAVCVAAAVVMALTTTPIYRAEASVVEVRDNQLGAMGGLASQLGGLASIAGLGNLATQDDGRNSIAVLKSRQLAEQFVTRHKLMPVMFRNSQSPPTLWHAVERFRKSVLSIREDKRTGITTVAIDWPDAATATVWANGFVALANEVIRARALADSTSNIKYLNEQIARTNVVEMQKVMYNLIETETKTLMLANARLEYAFKVVDAAVKPELRISPKRTVMVIIGGMLGMGLGLLLVFVHRFWLKLRT